MAFRAYFIRKSFTGIRKGQGRAFAGLGLVWEGLRQETMRSAVYTVEVSARMPPGSYTSAMIFARYTPEERRISCASAALPAPPGTEDENIVPGARPGLYVFLQHNVKRALCTALYSLTWAVMVYCAAVLSIAPPTDWIQPVLQMICCKGHPPSA